MDFSLTEEQLMFQKMVRDFAAKEIEPVAAQIDETEEFPWENFRKMAELGLTGITIAEEYGGSGGDALHLIIAAEEIAHACAATSTILNTTVSLCCYSVYKFGNEEQKRRFVVPLAKGEKIGCFALTEAGAGSDAAALETTAVRHGDGYILNGTKIFITNGKEADIVVVFATIDKSLRSRGITGFVVEKGTPGFSVGKKERKLGIRASSTTELVFEDCFVPLENRLAEEGQGFRLALSIIDSSRAVIAAQAVGIAQAAFDASLNYAKQRHQFGQPIAEFQAIQWMLVDMATAIDAARLLTYRAAYLEEKGLPFVKEAAMAKVFASEVAMAVTTKAIQIHGGYGYIKDYPVERYFRDAKITEIYEGTSEVQRLTIARSLLREG
ncbi:MAG: acyl-CoA dehydrogenase [Dehalococcoidia bacterium]|nr:MAG: acyl-CoA dehydrogenase [Dehalococcoidia bacterium]